MQDVFTIALDTVDSTNNYLKAFHPEEESRITLVTAEFQTAGRGATGGWESKHGENLVFSILTHPRMVKASDMFVLSEAICMAICRALNHYAEGFQIKWPNDVYYGDKKIVGILIENELQGKVIADSIMGVGVNVNQRVFASDAPNPSSLALLLGHEVNRQEVLERILKEFDLLYSLVEQGRREKLHREYLSMLYRKGVESGYRDDNGEFRAVLQDVEPTGHLVLMDGEGNQRRYAFKEVQFIIK